MEKILQLIANETGDESYRTSKFEFDIENSSEPIEYEVPAEIVSKHAGETYPPKNYLSLEEYAKNFSSSGQILNYFFDGSRHVYKIFSVWYVRLRDKKYSDSPFDGVVKV